MSDRYNEALEAAAKACRNEKFLAVSLIGEQYNDACDDCAKAILALREAEHEARGWYTASRVKNAPVFLEHRARGVQINSSWIDEAGEGETESFTELWGRILEEIRRSQALFLLIAGPDDFPLKGALVEVGMALALGKRVYVECHVELEGRTMRPLGSWIMDKKVTRVQSFEEAIACEADQRGAQQVSTYPLNATADPQSAPPHPGGRPVAWTTALALEFAKSAPLSFDVSPMNLWGEKGIPLYTHPGGQEKADGKVEGDDKPAPASPGLVSVPRELLDRCIDALQRHRNGHAPMRIPADSTDSDIVQCELQMLIDADAHRPNYASAISEKLKSIHDELLAAAEKERRNV